MKLRIGLLNFGSTQNCMSSPNLVTEIQLKLSNETALTTGESVCEFVNMLISQRYIKYI